jgi:hypothetical protein
MSVFRAPDVYLYSPPLISVLSVTPLLSTPPGDQATPP